MPYETYRDLKVWQEAKKLAVEIYKLTSEGKLAKDFGLREQMQRASVSIASNIAEGYERKNNKEFVRFLSFSRGSVAELLAQLEIALEINYVSKDFYEQLADRGNKIGAMLNNLVKARKQKIAFCSTESPNHRITESPKLGGI